MTGWQVLGTSVLVMIGLGIFGSALLAIHEEGGWDEVVGFLALLVGVFIAGGFLVLMIALATGTIP